MSTDVKLYPLAASQRFFYSTWEKSQDKHLLNIGTSLTLESDVDFDVLKQSIQEAYDHCECLRVRLTKTDDGQVMQYVVDKETQEISFFEFSHWKQEDADNEMKKWTSVPFERFDSPLSRIVMISMPGGFKGMYMLVDHMIMDAQGIFLFFKDVIEVYCSKKYGTPYPKPLKSFIQALEKDLKYMNNSKAFQRDKEYWYNVIKESEPLYTDVTGEKSLDRERAKYNNPNLRAVNTLDTGNASDILSFHLEPNPSDVLIKFCMQHNISMTCLLLTALRTYLQKVNDNQPDVSICNAVSRRATLLEKFSGGSRIQFFPCRTVVQTNETFLDACRKIQANQNQVFRHADYDIYDFFEARKKYYNLDEGQTYEPISLTYQPLVLRSSDVPDIRYKSGWYCNGIASQNLYLTVTHDSLDDGLDFTFEYRTEKYNFNDLEKIYYFVTRILFEGVNHPDETIAEVIANT